MNNCNRHRLCWQQRYKSNTVLYKACSKLCGQSQIHVHIVSTTYLPKTGVSRQDQRIWLWDGHRQVRQRALKVSTPNSISWHPTINQTNPPTLWARSTKNSLCRTTHSSSTSQILQDKSLTPQSNSSKHNKRRATNKTKPSAYPNKTRSTTWWCHRAILISFRRAGTWQTALCSTLTPTLRKTLDTNRMNNGVVHPYC